MRKEKLAPEEQARQEKPGKYCNWETSGVWLTFKRYSEKPLPSSWKTA